MSQLNEFMELITGSFNNKDQYQQRKESDPEFPFAEHINTICNDKIQNLPSDFSGYFLVEESYYTVQGKKRASSHLFLFEEFEEGIRLSSYEIPSPYEKNAFTYQGIETMDYSTLKPSEKFTPAIFRKIGGAWEGESTSQFTPVTTFYLKERFSQDTLSVHEVLEINHKRVFGYEVPILYQRIH